MIIIGSKHLRKRYNGTTNVGTVYQQNNKIWPYIVSTEIGDWVITLTSNTQTISADGGTITLTYSAKRTITDTWVNYDGNTTNQYKESREETATPTLTTNIGTISGNILTIPANTGNTNKTITVTATYGGANKILTITQSGVSVNYKYYAVTTDVYQVTAGGQTKTVPMVNNNGPTNSYYHGTVVFAIADGPETITASFITKDHLTSVQNIGPDVTPIPTMLHYANEYIRRFMVISRNKTTGKKMHPLADIQLTAYNTEAEAKTNAPVKYTKIDSGTFINPVPATIDTDYPDRFTLISSEQREEYYLYIYQITIPEDFESFPVTFNNGGQKNIIISSAISSNLNWGTGFGIVDLFDHGDYMQDGNSSTKLFNCVYFTEPPASSLTIETVNNNNGARYLSSSLFIKEAAYQASDANGNISKLTEGQTVYCYEWLYDSSTWLRIGQFTVPAGTQQGFICKHGVKDSLERVFIYPDTSDWITTGAFVNITAKDTTNTAANIGFIKKDLSDDANLVSVSANEGSAEIITNADLSTVKWTGSRTNRTRQIAITGVNGALTGVWKFQQGTVIEKMYIYLSLPYMDSSVPAGNQNNTVFRAHTVAEDIWPLIPLTVSVKCTYIDNYLTEYTCRGSVELYSTWQMEFQLINEATNMPPTGLTLKSIDEVNLSIKNDGEYDLEYRSNISLPVAPPANTMSASEEN